MATKGSKKAQSGLVIGKWDMVDVDELNPYVNNSRTHSDKQVEQIAASIKEYGFTNPVLIGKGNTVIAGHGRLMAAAKLDMLQVPVIRLDHLTKAQQKALVIADNKISDNSTWNKEMLAQELGSLKMDGISLDTIGFSIGDLAKLLPDDLAAEGDEDDGEAGPQSEATVITQANDIWICGEHRIVAGKRTLATVDAAVKAWQKASGKQATHAVTGKPFPVGGKANA